MKRSFAFLAALFVAAVCLTSAAAEADGYAVSRGAGYSVLPDASAAYPDKNGLLTDGKYGSAQSGAYYSSGEYVGFNSSALSQDGEATVIIDLGAVYDDLTAVSVGFLNETSVGVFAPKSFEAAVSDERNGDYTVIGTVDTAMEIGGEPSTQVRTLAFDPVRGRFVRVKIKALMNYTDAEGVSHNAGWTFIDEITVYAASAPESGGSSAPAESGAESGGASSAPRTGDGSTPVVILALTATAAIALAAAIFGRTRRRTEI